jgi:thioesterase domain-containing protein
VLQQYRPQPVVTPVQFFAANSRDALIELSGHTPPSDVDLGWSKQIGQVVDLHPVAGDHFSMMAGAAAASIARTLSQTMTASMSDSAEPQATAP